MKCLNIACGDSYVESWLNLDFAPHSPSVKKANLLSRLPVSDASLDVVYTSHFLEHIPKQVVTPFLAECFRVLKPGGSIRIVTPDFEVLCREYLIRREAGDHLKADFLVLEILDQCVRQETGGELGRFFLNLRNGGTSDLSEFATAMTGYRYRPEDIRGEKDAKKRLLRAMRHPAKAIEWLTVRYCRLVTLLLPRAFRLQNVSHTMIGERHQWLYDYHSLASLLREVGFNDLRKLAFDRTDIPEFPLHPLDVAEDGSPRKGKESMFVEARRPSL